jgi:hypothetical protein
MRPPIRNAIARLVAVASESVQVVSFDEDPNAAQSLAQASEILDRRRPLQEKSGRKPGEIRFADSIPDVHLS